MTKLLSLLTPILFAFASLGAAEKSAADRVVRFAVTLNDKGGRTGAGEQDRCRRAGRPGSDDQRRRSTHNRKGKQRRILASGPSPASDRMGRHSAGRNERAIESCPSSRTIGWQPMIRASNGKPR